MPKKKGSKKNITDQHEDADAFEEENWKIKFDFPYLRQLSGQILNRMTGDTHDKIIYANANANQHGLVNKPQETSNQSFKDSLIINKISSESANDEIPLRSREASSSSRRSSEWQELRKSFCFNARYHSSLPDEKLEAVGKGIPLLEPVKGLKWNQQPTREFEKRSNQVPARIKRHPCYADANYTLEEWDDDLLRVSVGHEEESEETEQKNSAREASDDTLSSDKESWGKSGSKPLQQKGGKIYLDDVQQTSNLRKGMRGLDRKRMPEADGKRSVRSDPTKGIPLNAQHALTKEFRKRLRQNPDELKRISCSYSHYEKWANTKEVSGETSFWERWQEKHGAESHQVAKRGFLAHDQHQDKRAAVEKPSTQTERRVTLRHLEDYDVKHFRLTKSRESEEHDEERCACIPPGVPVLGFSDHIWPCTALIQESKKVAKEDEFVETADPSTMLEADKADAKTDKKGKKGKAKKPKLTKAEKALAKLEKECEKLRSDHGYMDVFLTRMDTWFKKISSKAIKLFQLVDKTGDGIIPYDVFKAGMFDLNCPCNKIQLHLLAQVMDPDGEDEIHYNKFRKFLKKAMELECLNHNLEGEGRQLILSERATTPCPKCAIGTCEPCYREKYPKYVKLDMRLATFDKFSRHPGHFSRLLHTHIPVCGLIELIVQETKIASTQINVFLDKSRTIKARLNPHLTLEECGIKGGSKFEPEHVTVYYDYTTEFNDCSVLMCDHYFGKNAIVV